MVGLGEKEGGSIRRLVKKKPRTEMGGGGGVEGARVGCISEAQLQIWKLIRGRRTME